ncbi:uncharacterized protein TRIVIDRAFT_226259 [Trichoderma virens Gv29-8]|uniref:Uncharacterized protein n=1 Tax=Hypocrea virens (strain Gv29-8 / FGSC 10586) TaxID=413071 RepID=G9N5V7_HYPVG|nr:uncharacterized protein TRIVIDRAFT_226259 [Trichoderma virens Gv29-8]EHK18148.1 hypothetical protein TRIVIDRAFT_226259 [Trichoderma virens Gv29-8]UKZ53981.1 hypothetical protein TrVGV298_007785 [Trichoderma virens]
MLWRCFAITDRRMRAKAWGPADLTASNAYFWTAQGIGVRDLGQTRYCDASGSASSLYDDESVVSKTFAGTAAIDTIFFGLLRVWATFWLTDGYSYATENSGIALMKTGSSTFNLSRPGSISQLEAQPMTSIGLLGMGTPSSAPERRFHSTNSWRGWVFCILYILPVVRLWVLCVTYLLPFSNSESLTITTLLLVAFYLFFLSASLVIYTFYFVRGPSMSTIIPCKTSLWYKIYTSKAPYIKERL